MDRNELQNDDESVSRVKVDEDLMLELNFVPEWARKSPSQEHYYADKPGRSSRPPSRDRRDRGGPPARGRRPDSDRRRPPVRPERAPRETRSAPIRQPRPDPAPVEVRFLPDRDRLAAVARKIRATGQAYPIVDLASLFLSNPASCLVRIDVRADAPDVHMVQCGKCRSVALDGVPLLPHVIESHLEDYFEKEELLVDPPPGKFVCIARCGLSGVLLGPTNHHSFDAKAREIHRTRYPDMPFADYKKRIEQRHDEDLIEQWKEEYRKRTVYRSKESPEDEPVTWQEVEKHLEAHVVPGLMTRLRRVDLQPAVARTVKHYALREAVSDAWRAESRFPRNLSNALRGAFRNMQLYVFRAGRGHIFVTATRPVPLDKAHVIDSIRDVLTYLEQHPGCSRSKLREGLCPDSAEDSPEAQSILSPLRWLAERGHIIEFFDGSLVVPLREAPALKRQPKRSNKRRKRSR